MKKTLKTIVILSIILAIAMPNSYVLGKTNVRNATITSFSGDVNIMKSGGEKVFAAKKGMKLTHGDRIITGKNSWLKLDVDGDKELKVGAKTYISLEELTYDGSGEKTGVKLFKGKLWTNIKKKLGTDDEFEIRTPNAIMGARGTKFLVSYDEVPSDTGTNKNKAKLTVIEGTVQAVATATVKVKDQNGNVVDKQLTIAIDVEEGEDTELVLDEIQKELQSIADEVQSLDEDGEVNTDDIKKVIENKISNKEMKAMNVKKLDFEELDSFSIETIIEDINTNEETDESQELINNLQNILNNAEEEENQQEEQQQELINQLIGDLTIVYDEVVNQIPSTPSYTPPSIIYPTSITLPDNQIEIVMTTGNTIQLTPTVLPTNATNKSLIWTTSNSSVVTVDSGLITASGEGTATITATTFLGGINVSCNVLVENNGLSLLSAKTVDDNNNGIVDRVELTFNDSIDENNLDATGIIITADNGQTIGNIIGAEVNSDFDNILIINVKEKDMDNNNLNFNTGLTASLNIPEEAISSYTDTYSGTTNFVVSDGASPVLIDWGIDLNSDEKNIRLIFSEELNISTNIDTSNILITDLNYKTPIAINQNITSSSSGNNDSFITDIVFPTPEVPTSITDLDPSDGIYCLKLHSNAFKDSSNNNGVLKSNFSLLECTNYTPDSTKPSITEIVSPDAESVIITFNEFINADSLTRSKTGNVEFINPPTVLSGSKTIQFELNNLADGDTITVSNVQDLKGNNMTEEKYGYNGSSWIKIEPFGLVSCNTIGTDGIVTSISLNFNKQVNQEFNSQDIIDNGKIIINEEELLGTINSIVASENNVTLNLNSPGIENSGITGDIILSAETFSSTDMEPISDTVMAINDMAKPSISVSDTVNGNSTVRFIFSESMDPSTIITDNITYSGNSSIQSIQVIDAENTVFEIKFSSFALQNDEITFTTSITDSNGNSLISDKIFIFTSDIVWLPY